MHCSLGSATLLQLAFPGEKQPEFTVGEIPLGQYSCKKYFKQFFKKRKDFLGWEEGLEDWADLFCSGPQPDRSTCRLKTTNSTEDL